MRDCFKGFLKMWLHLKVLFYAWKYQNFNFGVVVFQTQLGLSRFHNLSGQVGS